MSAAQAVLPLVLAYAGTLELVERRGPIRVVPPEVTVEEVAPPRKQMAFYRKYTEAMLRRYVAMSMEAGRTPSLLGRELFRGKVTSYNVRSFEDVVMGDLRVLKSQMEQVMGIGQPGRLHHLEERVGQHEQSVHKMKGMIGGFGGLLTAVHVLIAYLGERHK